MGRQILGQAQVYCFKFINVFYKHKFPLTGGPLPLLALFASHICITLHNELEFSLRAHMSESMVRVRHGDKGTSCLVPRLSTESASDTETNPNNLVTRP